MAQPQKLESVGHVATAHLVLARKAPRSVERIPHPRSFWPMSSARTLLSYSEKTARTSAKKYLNYTLAGGDRVRGRFRDPADFARAYRDQSAFITVRIEETIEKILARSPEPPIIILQSDHGSELKLDMTDVNNTDLHERMSILNAYFFPDRKYDGLYSRISPVNSFRVVFNTFFGGNLELLPDRSYFSTWTEPYLFIDVTDRVVSPDGPNDLSTSTLSNKVSQGT